MHPRALRAAGRLLRLLSAERAGSDSRARPGLLRLMPASLRRLEPQAPRDRAGLFQRADRGSTSGPSSGEIRYRVALLTGCVQDLVFPTLNRDTADVLLANGCQVHTPPVQPCCGSLHAHNGERELAATARATDDRSAAAGSLRCDHHATPAAAARTCGTTAPLLSDDPAYARGRGSGTRRCATCTSGWSRLAIVRREAAPFDAATIRSRTTIPVTWRTARRVVSEPRDDSAIDARRDAGRAA